MYSENDVIRVLKDDGVPKINIKDFQNKPVTNLEDIKKQMGNPPWAARVVYNDRFGASLIAQRPGEGNRLHYHPDADECWVILEGEWEWYIEGEGSQKVQKNDIVVVRKKTKHKITVTGKGMGVRFALTKPDVDHVYSDKK